MSLETSFQDPHPEIRVFTLKGRLDASGGMKVYDGIRESLEGRIRIVLDLSGVDYMSSGGLSIIIRLVHHLRERGGDLHLASPSPFVRNVFDIVSFDAILKIFSGVDQAAEAFEVS
ncbi:STAS domain-containing protein [Gemmatimonadota bacterium]